MLIIFIISAMMYLSELRRSNLERACRALTINYLSRFLQFATRLQSEAFTFPRLVTLTARVKILDSYGLGAE